MNSPINIKSIVFLISSILILTFSGCGGDGKNGASSSYTLLGPVTTPPVDPIDPVDPVEPVDPIDPVEPIDPVTPVPPTKPEITLKSLEVKPANVSVFVGTTGNFTAIAHFSDNSTQNVSSLATWNAGNTSIVSIVALGSNAGYAEALAAGSTKVTASYQGLTSNSSSVVITEIPLESLELTPVDESIGVDGTVQYTVTGTYEDNTQSDLTGFVTYTLSDTSVASIDVHGLATTAVEGTTSITATSDDGITSNTATLTVVPVAKLRLYISPTDVTMIGGEDKYFTATLYYNNNTSEDVTNDAWWDAGHQGEFPIFSAYSGGRVHAWGNPGSAYLRANYEGMRSNGALITVNE